MEKRIYRFAYQLKGNTNTFLKPHQLRDGAAFTELSNLLYKNSYDYGGIFLNRKPPNKRESLIKVDTSFLNSNDIIVLTTRPPLNDHDKVFKKNNKKRKTIHRSFTSLENSIIDILRQYFLHCDRAYVVLNTQFSNKLKKENRFRCEFTTYTKAVISKQGGSNMIYQMESYSGEETTMAYFLYLKDALKNGISLIVSFGMGGVETLGWNFLFRTRHSNLLNLNKSSFSVIELTNLVLPERPENLNFYSDWESEIILHEEL